MTERETGTRADLRELIYDTVEHHWMRHVLGLGAERPTGVSGMTEREPMRDDAGKRLWAIGEAHPDYGVVQMMGITGGEAYRWFDNGGLVSMIPLFVLQEEAV